MKSVKVSELKAKLAKYLRMVKQGEKITVLDRNLPIAEIVSLTKAEDLVTQRSNLTFAEALRGMPVLEETINVNSLALLREERSRR